jgi:hypothetical protein
MAKTSNNTIKLSHKLAKAETEVCKTMIIKEDCKPPNAVHISNGIPFVKKKKKKSNGIPFISNNVVGHNHN